MGIVGLWMVFVHLKYLQKKFDFLTERIFCSNLNKIEAQNRCKIAEFWEDSHVQHILEAIDPPLKL